MKNIPIRALRLFSIFLAILSLFAQPVRPTRASQPNPFMVADVNPSTLHSYPFPFLQAGEQAYFFTYNYFAIDYQEKENRFYQTDGTPQGTRLVKYMGPGDEVDYGVTSLSAMFGGWFYFSVSDPIIGYTVGRTNGSEQGTTLVHMEKTFEENVPFTFLVFQEKLYFAGAYGIWYLDNPDSTPQPLVETSKTLYPGVMLALGDRMYFQWRDPEHGTELWESDGTPAGTHFLVDIFPGPNSSWLSLKLVQNGTLYIETPGSISGMDIWSYRPDQNLLTRWSGSIPFETDGDWGYFIKSNSSGSILCRTDGLGVENVSQLSSSSDLYIPRIIGTLPQASGELVLFLMENIPGEGWLYANDGTADGTIRLAGPFLSFSPLSVHLDGKIIFGADDGVHGFELWQTDGTPDGTGLVMDIYPGSTSGLLSHPFVCGSRVCFFANDGMHGYEPWGSDGTAAGTQLLVDSNPSPGGSNPERILPSGDKLYFIGYDGGGYNLYRTGLAAGGAELLHKGISLWEDDAVKVSMGDQFFYLDDLADKGYNLWWVVGPEAQPVLVKHIDEMSGYPSIETMQVLNQKVFFPYKNVLWTSNGLPGETRVLHTVADPINFLTTFNNRLVFATEKFSYTSYETKILSSDGSTSTPTFRNSINGQIKNSAQTNQSLFLNLSTSYNVNALWQMDSTTMTARQVYAPACLGSYGVFTQLTGVGDTLYFLNRSSDNTRLTLLKKHGVQTGVECVWSAEIKPEISSPVDKPMTTFQGNVFFATLSADGVQQVMMSDGTVEGTRPLPGQGTSAPGLQSVTSLLAGPDRLFFQARTSAGGSELWFWEGGEDLPRLAADLNPGQVSSSPELLLMEDGWLYFSANDGQTGRELWAFETSPAVSVDFTSDLSAGFAPLTVQFTSTSTYDVDTFTWDFGDGTTSSEANPSHIFNQAGQYAVSLAVSRDGEPNTITKTINVYDPVHAKFDLSPVAGIAPVVVKFSNQSSGSYTTLSWDFGEGSPSSEISPSHTYTKAGSYPVQLTASGPGGTDTITKTITVYDPVEAKFDLTPVEGIAPKMVQFSNQSSGSFSTQSWDFGDGAASGEANPTHIYSKGGQYTVRLNVSGDGGTDAITKTITIYDPVIAKFTMNPSEGTAPLSVHFVSQTSGSYTSLVWDFGDGATSREANPSHTYTQAGSYLVQLTAAGPGGTDQTSVQITVSPQPSWFTYLPLLFKTP